MPLISCEINIILICSVNCVLLSTNAADQGTIFTITDTKTYVPVEALSTDDNA